MRQGFAGGEGATSYGGAEAREDVECRCGDCLAATEFPALWCCRVHYTRFPETAVLLYLVVVVCLQFVVLWSGSARSVLAPWALGVLALYALAKVCLWLIARLACGKGQGYFTWGRFHKSALVVGIGSLLGLTFPLWANLGTIFLIGSRIESAFGSLGRTQGMSSTSFDLATWFWDNSLKWGPAGNATGPYAPKTYEYASGLTRPQGVECGPWTGSAPGRRPWSDRLFLDVFVPVAAAPDRLAPIIFFIHGGGWIRGDKDFHSWSFDYYLEQGYAIISSQYPYVCDGFHADDMLHYLTIALDYVRANASRWNLDDMNIVLMGESAGAYLALMLGYTLNSTDCGGWRACGIKGVIDSYGRKARSSSLFGLVGLSASGIAELTGTDDEEEQHKLFPLYHAGASSPPTVTFHGTWDLVVPYATAPLLHGRLEEVGVPHLLVTFHTWVHGWEHYYGMPAQVQRFATERVLWLLARPAGDR